MHAFIRGKDVGFSAERFYGGIADLLAGVEEEEGYVVEGRWAGKEGKEERKKKTMEVFTRTEEPASDNAGSADTLRRTASDKERWRMEEILRSTPSPPSSRSSPSSLCPEERVEMHLKVQKRRRSPVAAESDGPQDRDVALRRDSQQDVDQECIDSIPEPVQVRRIAESPQREDANLSTVSPSEPRTQSQAGSRERSSPSLPRL